jgi:hypothetical protein
MVTTRDIPYITDFRLIEKNKPKGLGNDCAACSSFLMPVWYQEQLLGVLFYGTAVFGLFSSLNNILNINDILYLQLVEPFFALHLSRHLGGSLTKKPSLIR